MSRKGMSQAVESKVLNLCIVTSISKPFTNRLTIHKIKQTNFWKTDVQPCCHHLQGCPRKWNITASFALAMRNKDHGFWMTYNITHFDRADLADPHSGMQS